MASSTPAPVGQQPYGAAPGPGATGGRRKWIDVTLVVAVVSLVAGVWGGSEHLRRQVCTRHLFPNGLAVDWGMCEEELRRVDPELAARTVDDFLGSASGANPGDAYDMVVSSSLSRREFIYGWKDIQWAERVGEVDALPVFNRYSVEYRTFHGPDDEDVFEQNVNEYTRTFELVSVAPGEAMIVWMGRVDRTGSQPVTYPKIVFRADLKEPLTFDQPDIRSGIAWDRASPGGWLTSLCHLELPDGAGSWSRTRLGWVNHDDIDDADMPMKSARSCDSHHADVSGP